MIFYIDDAIKAVNTGQDTPDAFYAKTKLIAVSKWKATDGWRGHYEVTAEPGYKIIESSWLTGDWDDAPHGHSESEVKEQLEKLEQEHGLIYVIFTPTSNVFSTAYDVLIKDPDSKPLRGKSVGVKTKLYEDEDGSFSVRYHATYVVRYNAKNGTYQLDTGGWDTMTTAKRMNQYLPAGVHVYRKNWELFVRTADGAEIRLDKVVTI